MALSTNKTSQTEVEDEVQVWMGDFHQVLSDFSKIHATLPICSTFPGSHEGILSKQRKAMLMKQDISNVMLQYDSLLYPNSVKILTVYSKCFIWIMYMCLLNLTA